LENLHILFGENEKDFALDSGNKFKNLSILRKSKVFSSILKTRFQISVSEFLCQNILTWIPKRLKNVFWIFL